MNWDYVAGFLDGEGTVGIFRSRRRYGRQEYSCRITIFQKDPDVLYKIQDFLKSNGIKSRVRPTYTYDKWDKERRRRYRVREKILSHYGLWIENNPDKLKFLESVVDRVYVKKDEVKKSLDFLYNRPQIRGWQTIRPEWVDEWVELYGKGLSTAQIAERYPQYPATITRWLRKRGVSFRLKRVSKSEVDEWVKLYREGYSASKIGEMTNRPANTVLKHLKKRGILIRR